MKPLIIASLLLLSFSAQSVENNNVDNRISLNLTAAEKANFLTEMRGMLVSIQGIMAGMGNNDRKLIARSAKHSGNRMARATPPSIKQKTPASFKKIGGPTHMMFEELAIRAEDDDMETLSAFTAKLMKQCLACHETFKAN